MILIIGGPLGRCKVDDSAEIAHRICLDSSSILDYSKVLTIGKVSKSEISNYAQVLDEASVIQSMVEGHARVRNHAKAYRCHLKDMVDLSSRARACGCVFCGNVAMDGDSSADGDSWFVPTIYAWGNVNINQSARLKAPSHSSIVIWGAIALRNNTKIIANPYETIRIHGDGSVFNGAVEVRGNTDIRGRVRAGGYVIIKNCTIDGRGTHNNVGIRITSYCHKPKRPVYLEITDSVLEGDVHIAFSDVCDPVCIRNIYARRGVIEDLNDYFAFTCLGGPEQLLPTLTRDADQHVWLNLPSTRTAVRVHNFASIVQALKAVVPMEFDEASLLEQMTRTYKHHRYSILRLVL